MTNRDIMANDMLKGTVANLYKKQQPTMPQIMTTESILDREKDMKDNWIPASKPPKRNGCYLVTKEILYGIEDCVYFRICQKSIHHR